MHAKLALVLLVIGYHHGCGVLLRRFEAGAEPAQPPLVPLVQRSAGAAAAGHRDAGGRQAVLSAVATQHKTVALPLALAYAALIVYASLYPFTDWRDQGIAPWAYLAAPWPKYWTGFDFGINVVGYMPLGFLAALAVLRTRPAHRRRRGAVLRATLAGAAISFAMETLQSYLPARVPSNVDLGLNVAGALVGAVLAAALERLGAVAHWSRARASWFVEDARGALVLLALWPVALLFPAAVHLRAGPGVRAAGRRASPSG